MENVKVTLHGKTGHYFMPFDYEKQPCEAHDYSLVKLTNRNLTLHCKRCDDKKYLN